MKYLILLLISILAGMIGMVMVACEKHKDPFSAQNAKPVIADFRFKPDPNLPNIRPDSLKFKTGASYKLYLKYEDPEFSNSTTKKLQARFWFESGSGKISHDQFNKPSDDGLSFGEVPGKFDNDLLFTPGAPGVVRLRLQLSDGVKTSETQQASVTFFENLKPVPFFTVRFLTQTNPYRVEFNPERSLDRDGDINKATFIWSFGDNSAPKTNIGKTPITHDYVNAGQYRVRLRIIDDESKADSTEQLVTTANQPPVAALRITPTTSGKVPFEIDYTATGSFDPDGTISSYQIFFGDGDTSQQPTGKHVFKTDGNYPVTVIVKDNLGLADTASVGVRVSTPPTAVLKINPESGGPVPLRLVVSGKESRDPHPGGSITAYNITITNVTTNAQRVFPQDSVTTLLTEPANYRITLDVTNNRGLSSRAEKVVPAGLPGIIRSGDDKPPSAFLRKP
ncbi:MAG: PKD domain-containing protein [candidate division KSB1 bacterium]|nr:PKD domain-containing protein [candidate division KSB1 bacterium]MDZ7364357.1 PKD domain-containing protein [candidate division KSB1 bacterium]MDZ7402729.1 PKD domain-containing protein [candidate division KSB1 bacterium]